MATPGFDAFDLSFTLFGNTNLSFARSAVAEQYTENFSVSSQDQDDFDIPIDFGVEKYESRAGWSGNWTQHFEETETGVTLIIEGSLDPDNSASVTTDFEQIAASGTMNGFLALGIRPSYPTAYSAEIEVTAGDGSYYSIGVSVDNNIAGRNSIELEEVPGNTTRSINGRLPRGDSMIQFQIQSDAYAEFVSNRIPPEIVELGAPVEFRLILSLQPDFAFVPPTPTVAISLVNESILLDMQNLTPGYGYSVYCSRDLSNDSWEEVFSFDAFTTSLKQFFVLPDDWDRAFYRVVIE